MSVVFRTVFATLATAAAAVAVPAQLVAQRPDIRGAWSADTYLMKDGGTHPVRGLIFFDEEDWTVLFFVVPAGQDSPRRGSAEGGTYTLSGEDLVFRHQYHLSSGQAIEGLSASPLRMEVHDEASAQTEPCRVAVEGDRMTIRFPSGNAMTFQRRPGP